jgi:hypothetical protein
MTLPAHSNVASINGEASYKGAPAPFISIWIRALMRAAIEQQPGLFHVGLRQHERGCAAGPRGGIRVKTFVERLSGLPAICIPS